jgi:hypothetical protein
MAHHSSRLIRRVRLAINPGARTQSNNCWKINTSKMPLRRKVRETTPSSRGKLSCGPIQKCSRTYTMRFKGLDRSCPSLLLMTAQSKEIDIRLRFPAILQDPSSCFHQQDRSNRALYSKEQNRFDSNEGTTPIV